jgi:hypothetical protein
MKAVALIAATLLVGWVTGVDRAWSQEEMTVVDNSVFESPRRPPSVFLHDEHNEIAEIDDCAACHHVYEDGELVEGESSEDQSCSECHDRDGSDGMPSLIKAFHLNCKGCHEAQGRGPIMCGECHQK